MKLAAIAVAAAVALTPSHVRGLQWNARAGLEYRHQDSWLETGERLTTPRLDVNLALDARGFVGTPETFDWNAAVEYRRLTVSYAGEAESLSEGLTYRLRTVAFGSAYSPLMVTAHAERSRDDLSRDGPSATAESDSYGATARVQLPGRPRLELGYNRFSLVETNPVLGEHTADRDTFSAGVGHGTSDHSYGVSYRGTLSSGTFVSDNYDEHRADVTASANLNRRTRLILTDSFYRREPTSSSEFNPRQDANFLTLRLNESREDGARDFQQAVYSYATGFSEAPSRPTFAREAHRVTYRNLQTLHGPEWSLLGSATLSLDESQLGDVVERTAGQALGATAVWRRERSQDSLELRAGPTLGLLERFDGEVHLGYGGTAGTTIQRGLSGVTARGRYDVDYASGIAESGWSLTQQLTLGADGRLGRGMLGGQLIASAQRGETPLRGDTASRSLTGVATYATRSSRLELRLGVQDNLSGGIQGAAAGDGLFIAPSYDSHVRSASLLASTTFARRLSLTAVGRVASTSLPDRPSFDEVAGYGTITYSLGAFGISIDDRYVVTTGSDGRTRRVNEVIVRAFRTIGGGQGYSRR